MSERRVMMVRGRSPIADVMKFLDEFERLPADGDVLVVQDPDKWEARMQSMKGALGAASTNYLPEPVDLPRLKRRKRRHKQDAGRFGKQVGKNRNQRRLRKMQAKRCRR